MQFRNIKINELEDFIASGEYCKYDVLPISDLRAFSQVKNPHALPNDVVLTIAHSGGKVMGFVGALPDTIYGEHAAWNSCWWVAQGTSGDISLKLLLTFVGNWNRKVLFSEMTPHTSQIIQRLGFCKHFTISGFRGYYRFAMAYVFPSKKSWLKKIKPLLMVGDVVLNVLIRIFRRRAVLDKTISIEQTDLLSVEDETFIGRFNQTNPSKRQAADFNWIQKNGWLSDKLKTPKSYFFSYKVTRFESKWVRFYRNNKQFALVNFTIRDKEIKLPYVFCDVENANYVADYFMGLLKTDKSLALITTFHPELSNKFMQKHFLFTTRLPKYSAISTELYHKLNVKDFEFQMGDGDCVFT